MRDYNHNGVIDGYDEEMDIIFLDDDEKAWGEVQKHSSSSMSALVFFVVVGIIAFLGFLLEIF